MLIEVTQDDIARGEPRSPTECPVNRGIQRATGCLCSTRRKSVLVSDTRIPLPPTVTDWIDRFDGYGPPAVEPMTFELPEIPMVRAEEPALAEAVV